MSERMIVQHKKAASETSTSSTFTSLTRGLLQRPATSPQAATQVAPLCHNLNKLSLSRPRAKLTVSQPGDPYEQEADRVAEQVMRMDAPESVIAPATGAESNKSLLRTGGDDAQAEDEVAPIVGEVLQSGGRPLDNGTRAFMEPRFGHDFSRVRIHTDSRAAESAQAVNALAYTVGQDVVFGSGQYALEITAGKRLLAHELTHVVQQQAADAVTPQTKVAVSSLENAAERKANWVADWVIADTKASAINGAAPGIYRQNLPGSSSTPVQSGDDTSTNQGGGSDPGAEPSWREMGNLQGNPPVRSETNPPNKNIVEDEAVYNQRNTLAKMIMQAQQERAKSLLDERGNVKDYRYWFAQVYKLVTKGEIKYAESNTFFYPSYVMASVDYFEQIYKDNFDAFNDQGPVEKHWRTAFEEAARQKEFVEQLYKEMVNNPDPDAAGGIAMAVLTQQVLGAVQSLVASMQAHIRFDLPRAEAWVFNSYYSQFERATLDNFRPDFMSMSGIFDEAAREMNIIMAEKLGVPVNLIPQLLQDTSMRHLFDADMVTERADTWGRAEELVTTGQAGTDPYRGRMDGNVTQSDNRSGIDNIPKEELRPDMEDPAPSDDDKAHEYIDPMSDSEIADLSAVTKIRMLRGLLRGATVGDDETTVLRILKASVASSDLVSVIDGADAWDIMYSLDGGKADDLRIFFGEKYYGQTTQNNALRLIQKCLNGQTARWEQKMVVDLLEKQPNGRSIVEKIDESGGPATGADAKFKNRLYKLEWQLDRAEEDKLHQLFGSSDLGWWNF